MPTFVACVEVILSSFLPLVWLFSKNSFATMAAEIIFFTLILVYESKTLIQLNSTYWVHWHIEVRLIFVFKTYNYDDSFFIKSENSSSPSMSVDKRSRFSWTWFCDFCPTSGAIIPGVDLTN